MFEYPTYIVHKGIEYDINTDFKVGLKCFEVINDPNINDIERTIGVVTLLFGEVPVKDIDEELLEKVQKYLQCGETPSSKESDLDFVEDSKAISASFMSDYHIDLSKAEMHWWRFNELISGFTPNAIMSKIRDLRTIDLNKIKDKDMRREYAKAKQRVALKKHRKPSKASKEFLKLLEGS